MNRFRPKINVLILILTLLGLSGPVSGFVSISSVKKAINSKSQRPYTVTKSPPSKVNLKLLPSSLPFNTSTKSVAKETMLNLSGGDIANAITSSLQSGPFGVPALAGVAASVLTPLTLYRQGFSFSVGYGYSMLAIGISLLRAFPEQACSISVSSMLDCKSPACWLALSLMFYGARLGSFILFRNVLVKSKADKFKDLDKTPRLKRIPLILNVAIFYSFLASPALYAFRGATSTGKLLWTGVYAAWIGAILEAIADAHKFVCKRGKDEAADFAGPTGGLYALSRHPNYLFELVYWYGLFLGGIPSFGMNPLAWVCSSLGIVGITFIMTNATKRLDKQQEEKYGGQESYDSWRENVPYPLVPFFK